MISRPPGKEGTVSLHRTSSEEAEPLSHARMVFRRSREEVVLTGLSAKAQPPMMVGDKTKLSATVCATVLVLGQEAAPVSDLLAGRGLRRVIRL
jgi:hypothetical protein